MSLHRIVNSLVLALCLSAIGACRSGSERRALIVLHPHEESPASAKGCTSVFLAGTIDMGAAENWQEKAADLFGKKASSFVLYNPRQTEWHPEREGEMDYQVRWELEHLEKADWILMNFLAGSQSPVTLLEMGLHARSRKLLVICTPGYFRYDNVRITCEKYSVPLFATLEEAIDAIPDKR